jgi:hypothetical protein
MVSLRDEVRAWPNMLHGHLSICQPVSSIRRHIIEKTREAVWDVVYTRDNEARSPFHKRSIGWKVGPVARWLDDLNNK